MGRLSENCVLNIKNKSHSITAEIVVPEAGAEDVIIAQGANIGAGASTRRTASSNTATTWRGCISSTSNPQRRCPWASTRSARVRLRRLRPRQGGEVTRYVDGKIVGEGAV